MGLKKHITLQNGIQVNYHRVVSVHVITNVMEDDDVPDGGETE